MTSDLSLPLTVLVVGADDEMIARLAAALPEGEADVVRIREFGAPPIPTAEFIDLCILDASGDDGTGVELARRARRRWPTIGVCAVGCRDIASILTAGADDAVPHDAPDSVLHAQIAAAFRRARIASAQLRVSYGDMIYDREARRVWVAGNEVSLTPRELRLFDILFLRAGAPVSLDTLQDYVWKDDGPPASNALNVYVSYLRRKLRGSRMAVVETMRGIGYRLARKQD